MKICNGLLFALFMVVPACAMESSGMKRPRSESLERALEPAVEAPEVLEPVFPFEDLLPELKNIILEMVIHSSLYAAQDLKAYNDLVGYFVVNKDIHGQVQKIVCAIEKLPIVPLATEPAMPGTIASEQTYNELLFKCALLKTVAKNPENTIERLYAKDDAYWEKKE